jgi:hypothetical protein
MVVCVKEPFGIEELAILFVGIGYFAKKQNVTEIMTFMFTFLLM